MVPKTLFEEITSTLPAGHPAKLISSIFPRGLLFRRPGVQRTSLANSFREGLLLGCHAMALANFGARAQFEIAPQRHPRSRIRHRVVDLQCEVDRVPIHALIAF